MPIQVSTILYLSEYKEKISSRYSIGKGVGYTRLEEDTDQTQKFNITAFYPNNDSEPCYLQIKLNKEQILSVSNSKISQGSNGELDVSYLYFLKKIIFTNKFFINLFIYLFIFLANFNFGQNSKH